MPNLVEQFISESCVYAPGALLPFGEFAERFAKWAEPFEPHIGKRAIPRLLPPSFPMAAHSQNVRMVGNIAWRQETIDLSRRPIVKRNGRLVRSK